MAFSPLKALSAFWKRVTTPETFTSSAMFRATKKFVYKAAYEAGVKVGELATFLKDQGAKNIPSNIKTDVDQYYRQLGSFDELSKLPRNVLAPESLITREMMRRQRKFRYIVEGIKFDSGSGHSEQGTYSFWVDETMTLEELERTVNSKRSTIDQYDGAVQSYQFSNLVAIVQNTSFVEPTT